MDARKELLAYLGTSLGTIAVLFTAQLWYESYLDVAVVHAQQGDPVAEQKLATVREQEKAKLGSGKKSIDQAMHEIAERGRSASPALAATPSDDVSAMSGWIHRHGFAAYEPRKPPPPPPAAVPAEGEAGAVGVEGGAAVPTAEGAPADGAAVVPAPEGKPAAAPAAAAPKPGRMRIMGGTQPPAAATANQAPTGR